MSHSPKLFLAMDNCFAIKRWITPDQWFPLIKEMGAKSIEASTDNEVDPLFLPSSYLDDWVARVKALEIEHDMRVRSFFTGYQTYRTAGLAHPDERVRTKLIEDWFKPLICKAGQLGADIGFSFHAVCEEELNSPEKYALAIRRSNECFAHLAQFAWDHNQVSLCCEQMYAPYQPPFTIEMARRMLKEIYDIAGKPFYIANDVGHMVGQRRYRMPTEQTIALAIEQVREKGCTNDVWLGPDSMYKKVYEQARQPYNTDAAFIRDAIDLLRADYRYMFSFDEKDSDPYQ
ncbi:MAG: TIM barrel protein, partial [Clostridia bacterium]|nr:TIM barrel protein [Clostridia bacterium]